MAASHFFYNDRQLDSYDGTSGVLVSRVEHDSTPDIELSSSAIARSDGQVFHQQRARQKTIRLEGQVIGTDKQDLERRVDAFKALLSDPQGTFEITNYGTYEHRVAVFEEGEAWTREYIQNAAVDDSPLWDFTNYQIGTRGLIVEATTTSGAKSATLSQTWDLSTFADADTITLWAYVPDATKLASVRLRFETSAGTDYYSTTWSSGFVNGWNELTVLRSALTSAGTPAWSSITRLQLTVTASGTNPATVTFDDLRVSTDTDDRTYTVSLAAPVEIPREHFHIDWCPFSVEFSCLDGVGRSSRRTTVTYAVSRAAQHVPLYLGGSGPQPLSTVTSTTTGKPHSVVLRDHFTETFGAYEGRSCTSIATFESTETWTGGAADTVNVKVGSRARKVTATASTTATATRTVTADYSALANSTRSCAWAYLDSVTNLSQLELVFHTVVGTDYYTATYTAGSLAVGSNLLRTKKRDFVATGSPSWATIVRVEVRATANASGTVNASFDDWRWEDALNATGGTLVSDQDAPPSTPPFEIAPCLEFPTTLAYLGSSATTTHVAARNRPMQDGEVIALIRSTVVNTLTHGLFARATSTASTATRIEALASSGVTPERRYSLTDGAALNVSGYNVNVQTGTGWYWHRLVCRGARVQYFLRSIGGQQWLRIAEGTTTTTDAGYWGVSLEGNANVAHLELIDYASDARSTLSCIASLGSAVVSATDPPSATVAGDADLIAGSTGVPRPGLNTCSVVWPSSYIADPQFRFPESFNAWTLWGGATTQKIAIKVVSGVNTYLQTRGNYVYLAKDKALAGGAAPPAALVKVELQTDSAGAPSGTPAGGATTSGYTATGTALLSTLAGLSDGSGGTTGVNASIVPLELGFSDTPLTAATTYWLVFSLQDASGTPITNEAKWRLPIFTTAPSTDRTVKVYNGSAWVDPGGVASSGIYLLAGNAPADAASWTHTVAITPTYR